MRKFVCLLAGISLLTFIGCCFNVVATTTETTTKPAESIDSKPENKLNAEPKTVFSELGVKVTRDTLEAKTPLPVLTVHFAEMNKLLAVAKKVAGIVEVSETQFDEAVNSALENVEGLSKTEPIGFVFRANGNDFSDPLFVLPIEDLSKFSIPNSPFLQVKKIEDGKFHISLTGINLIAYQKKGYAVAVLETSTSPIPENPKAYFSDIEKYTMGVKADFANTSYDAIAKLIEPFLTLMAAQSPQQAKQFRQSIEVYKLYFDEFKTYGYCIEIDPETLDTEFVLNFVPSDNSKMFSKFFTSYKDRKTIFGGFKSSKPAIFKLNQSLALDEKIQLPEETSQLILKAYDPFFDGFLKQIEEDAENDEVVKHANDVVNSIKKLIAQNTEIQSADSAVLIDADGTFLFGTTALGDTETIADLFNSILSFIRARGSSEKVDDFLKANWKQNYEKISDFDLSELTIPFADFGDIKLSELADKSYTVFVAVKDKTAVIAGGFDADKTKTVLKTALESTSNPVPIKQPLLQFDLQALGQFLKSIGLEEIDKGQSFEGLAKEIVDLMATVSNKAKAVFTDKLEGTAYVVSIKVDGEITETAIKIAKQILGKIIFTKQQEESTDVDQKQQPNDSNQ